MDNQKDVLFRATLELRREPRVGGVRDLDGVGVLAGELDHLRVETPTQLAANAHPSSLYNSPATPVTTGEEPSI